MRTAKCGTPHSSLLCFLPPLIQVSSKRTAHTAKGAKPFSPVVRQKEDGPDKSRWVVSLSDNYLFARSSLEWIVQGLNNSHTGGHAQKNPSLLDEVVGGAKEIVNQLGRRTAASLSESMGMRYV